MMSIEFPIFKTKIVGLEKKFDLTTPSGRKEYFEAKAGEQIKKIKKYLDQGGTFIAYLLGKKNSGKGTYAKLFAEVVDMTKIVHISIGDLVRQTHKDINDKIKRAKLIAWLKNNYRGPGSPEEELKVLLSRDVSKLLPTEFILALTKREIAKFPRRAIFLDGFPRGLDQVSFSLYFRDLIGYREDPDMFILIDVPTSIIDERIKYRRSCPVCHTPRNLKLLRTDKIGFEKETGEYYLICDNIECRGKSHKMVKKESDELGIEPIRNRIEADDALVEKAYSFYGIPKVLLRSSIPVDKATELVDDYELTPEYVYQYDKVNNKVKVSERPWTIIDDQGRLCYSFLPPAVGVSLINQMLDILELKDRI